jgi:hypothetical protein
MFVSAIGHADTASIVSADLGIAVPCNRVSLSLKEGDALILAQYKGVRLPEGTTVLPEGAEIVYYYVTVVNMKKLYKKLSALQEIKNRADKIVAEVDCNDYCAMTALHILTGDKITPENIGEYFE